MDDNVSIKSSDSLTTSGEYEIVPEAPNGMEKGSKSPTLNIANNGDMVDLKKDLTEVIKELDVDKEKMKPPPENLNLTVPSTSTQKSISLSSFDVPDCNNSIKSNSDILSPGDVSTPDINKVGQSVFYDCMDLSPIGTEKQDDMKPEKSETDEESSDNDQGCTIFSGVTYLGATKINSPKSGLEIQRNMADMNSGPASAGMKASVSIPSASDGSVILYDAETNSIISSYEINRILYYERGQVGSKQEACFAFTWSHGDTNESRVHQCHVFRCNIPEAVNQVNSCFAKAFHCYPLSLTGSITSAVDNNSIMLASITSDMSGNPLTSAGYEFIVSLEIRERVTKNSYSPVPRDRSCFKLRCNTDKEVCITVKQTPSTILQALYIERCFGVLLSPGKLVRQADMQLLDMVSMGYQKSDTTAQCLWPYQITAQWKAIEKAFEQLNYESQKTYITVAVDLVIKGIQEPVRFVIESPVTIQSQNEIRIMDHFMSKRAMSLRFYLQLKKTEETDNWEVSSIDPSEEILEQSNQSSILKGMVTRMVRSTSTVSIEDDFPTEYSSDGDEPLLSGTGEVSKDCSQNTLDEWDPILKEWNGEKRPKHLPPLVRLGVPEALRGKIWQKLANVENKADITDRYRLLITKETKCEAVILRDIHRTFPAHKCFKETGGSGQDGLFKVSKAYAVYDTEVGYCQGLSFIAASLLLHMPEEDAFCVLVALMYDYGLRDLYKDGFVALYMRLYQLDRLIKDQIPKLYEHFERTGIETHMFASQWFLTLFTARFPLYFVFHVLDVFLLDGVPILFQVALTLLSHCEADLRQLDFEGMLKYFRVTLPKRCRNSSQSNKLMKMACERKVKRLKQYEEDFLIKKQLEEREELEARLYEEKFGEERKKLKGEIGQLQQTLEQVNEKASQDEKKHAGIIQDYKHIIQRQEQQITKLNELLENLTRTVSKCQKCAASIAQSSPEHTLEISKKQREDPTLGPLDPLIIATQRIRELELELAQTKLAQVEAECKNQDLNHQLNTTLTELQSNNRGSWQPWISKTINSIQEKVSTRRDVPTFQSYTNSNQPDNQANQEKGCQQLQPHSLPNMSPKLRKMPSNVRVHGRNSLEILPNKTDHPILRDTLSLNMK